jgi:16S rRNA processing protein RimM
MGRITAPFGIKGWVKLQPFTASAENLLAYPKVWVATGAAWQEHTIEHAQVQGTSVVAKLTGCDGRDAAARYRGREVAVPRAALPAPADNEFYWADLIGLQVVNVEGEKLGRVDEIFQTGANDVLVVKGDRERLIPFTEQVIRRVDTAGGVIHVDWSSDY